MIELNQNLENLNNSINTFCKLKKLFITQSSSSIISLISNLDQSKKGYLTVQQLCTSNSLEFTEYINSKFCKRISYSMLATYLQKIQSISSLIQQQIQQMISTDIIKYLQNQYLIKKYKQKIIMNIHMYIVELSGENKIKYKQFEQYCHHQKLSVNPQILFNILSQNQGFILGFQRTSVQLNGKIITGNQAKHKINMINMILSRLNQRIQKFGQEWL